MQCCEVERSKIHFWPNYFFCASAGAAAAGAAITFSDTSNTASTQFLCFQKDAYTFVSLPGDVPGGTDMAYQETDPETGVSLRFVRDYNSVYDLWVCRFDVYWGIAPLYREFAVRVAGA